MFLDEVRVLCCQSRFRNVDAATLKLLALAGDRLTFEAGEQIMAEGEESDSVFILLAGEAEIARAAHGVRVVIAKAQVGAVVGEIGVVLRERRSASLTATTPVTALRIEAANYLDLIRQVPQLAFATIQELSRQVLHVTSRYTEARASCEADKSLQTATAPGADHPAPGAGRPTPAAGHS